MNSSAYTPLRHALKQIGSKGYLSEDDDYEIAQSHSIIHTKTNNFFSENILSENCPKSEADLKSQESEISYTDSNACFKKHMNRLHNDFKEKNINQLFEETDINRILWHRSKIRYHTVTEYNDRKYYESYYFNHLIKTVKAKVLL